MLFGREIWMIGSRIIKQAEGIRFSHRVEEIDLKGGDHIYTWRPPFGLYAHHGIYVGEGKVVHFTQISNLSSSRHSNSTCSRSDIQECGVIISDLPSFKKKGRLYRYDYGVSKLALVVNRSGTCTMKLSDPPEDVIHRTNSLVGKEIFGKYDLLTNNCEDFALYCKTEYVVGNPYRDSGRSGQALTVTGAHVSLIRSLSLVGFVHPLGILAVAALSHAVKKHDADIGVRKDASRVKLEQLASYLRFYNWCREHKEIIPGLIPNSAGILFPSYFDSAGKVISSLLLEAETSRSSKKGRREMKVVINSKERKFFV